MTTRRFPAGAALVGAMLAITPASAFAPAGLSRVAGFRLPVATSAGEGQGTGGTSSGNGPGPRAPAPSTSDPLRLGGGQPGDPLDQVLILSQEAQSAIRACRVDTPACVADALDAYAARLEALAPRLGPRYRALPAIVRRAARKVRAAKTGAEAAGVVELAIAEVNRTIGLLAAEDPDATQTGGLVGRSVDQTLEVAAVKLLRSSDM